MARLEIDLSLTGIAQSTRGFNTFSESIEKNLAVQKTLATQLDKVRARLKSGDGDYTKLRGQQESIRQSVNGLNRDLRNQVAVMQSTDGSLVQMRARLSQLRTVYDNLSGAQRNNSNTTKTLVAEINNLNSSISKAEQGTGRFQRNVGNYGSSLRNALPQLAQYATLAGGIALAFRAVGDAARTIGQFDSGLRNVEKTTGLTRVETSKLGDEFIELSRTLQTVSSQTLTEYATVAGQLGIKGTKDILAFTEALAKLETASNITGEQGGAEIARTLTLIDGGVQNVRSFADEIVNLGNNFPATEKEILANAEAIAQNVGIYKIGRQEVLAFATATKSVGIEAELVGSTFSRTLARFERAIRTGKGLDTVLRLLGTTQAELSERFKRDSAGVFVDFIGSLNSIDRAGGSVNEQLQSLGLTAVRDQRVIQSLAVNGYDVLTSSLETVRNSVGSLDQEFTTASDKLIKQTERIGIAWDNLILTIDNGEGAIGKSTKRISGFFANVLDSITDLVKESTNFGDIFAAASPIYLIDAALEKGRNQRDVRSNQTTEEFIKGLQSGGRYDFFERTTEKTIELTNAQEVLAEQVVKNKSYWEDQVKSINAIIAEMDVAKKGTQEWTQAQNDLAAAQRKLDEYNKKSLTGGSTLRGKSQADLIREANDAINKGQVGALRGVDAELLKIENKYDSIFRKINNITDATVKGQLTATANVNKELEVSRVRLDAWLKEANKIGFSGAGVRGITDTTIQSASITSLPGLARAQARINNVSGQFADKDLEKRIGRVVERGLRNGFSDIFNSIDDLGSNFYEVFSNVFGKLASTVTNTFGQVIATQLGDLLSGRLNSDDLSIAGLGSSGSKALVAGGGLLGGILSGQGQRRNNAGLSIAGGALSGAATGAVFGPWGAAVGAVVGAIAGIFQSAGAKKQEKLQEAQLEEQKKATALAERQAALAYSSSIIGQATNQGIVNSIDRDAFGNLVATLKGSDIQIALDRTNNNR